MLRFFAYYAKIVSMERNSLTAGNDNTSGQEDFLSRRGAGRSELPLHGEELAETKKLLKLVEAHLSGTRGVARSTLDIAMGCLTAFVRYTRKPPWKWIKQDLSDFIHAKKEECDLSLSRQASYFTYLRIFQNYLLSDRALCNDIHKRFSVQPQEFIGPENSIPIRRRGRVRKRIVVGLTENEYERLIGEFDASIQMAYESGGKALNPLRRDKVMVITAYLLGLRVAELCSLSISSFSEDPEYPHFGPYALWTVIGKGSKLRVIRAFNPEIRDLMEWYIMQVRPRFLSDRVERPDLLFLSERGCELCDEQFRRRLKRIAAQAGIQGKHVTPHVLRHTNGTQMVHLIGAEGAREQMGHEHLSTTLGTYYHEDPKVIGDKIRRAVTGITAALNDLKH